MTEQLLKLPEKPGTVIAIGGWWLVRLPHRDEGPSAWELLPFACEAIRDRAESIGVKAQCIYGDDWVLAEAEQEGGYLVIADPREEPSGVRYYRPIPATKLDGRDRGEEGQPIWDGLSTPPRGARVGYRGAQFVRGQIIDVIQAAKSSTVYARVRWDDGTLTRETTDRLEPEESLPLISNQEQDPRDVARALLGEDR